MGTIADKLTYLGETKSLIRTAISSKGVTVPTDDTFRNYANKISEIQVTGDYIDRYTRPIDWLNIDNLVTIGEEKFVGLYAVFNTDANFITIQATSNFKVNWGNGVETLHTANSIAGNILSYNDYVGTESVNGYRQAIITVTPATTFNLTSITLQNKHSLTPSLYASSWLDIKMAGSLVTGISIGSISSVAPKMLEIFKFVGTNNITSTANLFFYCVSLRIVEINTSLSTNCNSMFRYCSSMLVAPNLNLNSCTNTTSMYSDCSRLISVPLYNLINVTVTSNMFLNCVILQNIPLFNLSNCITATTMFSACSSLTFLPNFNLSKATAINGFLSNTAKLLKIPDLTINTTATLNMTSMISSAMMVEIGALNLDKATLLSNVFTNLPNLKRCKAFNYKLSVAFSGTQLSRIALIEIFNNLQTVTGQTITITSSYGASSLTADDRLIATNKGWTIVG